MERPSVRHVLVSSLAFLVVTGGAAAWVVYRSHTTPTPPFTFAGHAAPTLLHVARTTTVVPPAPETETEPNPTGRCAPEPPIVVTPPPTRSTADLLAAFRSDPASIGPASLGTHTRGALLNAVALRESPGIARAGDHPWGTPAVVGSIERAVREVRRCHPGTQRITVGDLSNKQGGWLSPHRSHQAGLDADIGYYYLGRPTWFEVATKKNLDVVRTWALMRALIDGGNVEMIFVDRSVQALLREHVETLPEEKAKIADLFESPLKKDAMLRHAWGHATHFHVRFRDPDATALGALLARAVPRTELVLATQGKSARKPKPPPRPPARPKAPPPRPPGPRKR